MMTPQEIEDEGFEQILDRVAAVDVGKAFGMVCTRVPHPDRPGRRRTRVWQVDATTRAVLELADQLVAERVEKVTLESTSDYWRIWFYLLEAAGLQVQLIRAQPSARPPPRPRRPRTARPATPAPARTGPATRSDASVGQIGHDQRPPPWWAASGKRGDVIAADVPLPSDIRPGDLLAVAATGAHHHSMAFT